eukprot:COSAG01_NODE_5837_length_4003_cov_332.200390_7_plen_173_part_00
MGRVEADTARARTLHLAPVLRQGRRRERLPARQLLEGGAPASQLPPRGVATPLFRDKNTRHIGKSQSSQPHRKMEPPAHLGLGREREHVARAEAVQLGVAVPALGERHVQPERPRELAARVALGARVGDRERAGLNDRANSLFTRTSPIRQRGSGGSLSVHVLLWGGRRERG